MRLPKRLLAGVASWLLLPPPPWCALRWCALAGLRSERQVLGHQLQQLLHLILAEALLAVLDALQD